MTPFKETNRITSPYGYRKYTNSAGQIISEHHNGIDLVCTKHSGESVPAESWDFRECTGGKVVEVSTAWNYGRGTLVKVQTAPGVIEIYQHNAVNYVKAGQEVKQGTVLARAGATGNVTGVHLHFEVQINGVPVDPSPWLGLPNAVGTYKGNDDLDGSTPEQNPVTDPENLKTVQLVTLAPLTDDEVRLTDALAESLGLDDAERYSVVHVTDDTFAAVGTMTNGDAMKFLALAQQNGWDKQQKYHSRFVG